MAETFELDRPSDGEAEAEARFAFALEAAEIAAWDWDLRCGRTWWSARLEELYGVVPDPAAPWPSFSKAIHPEDKPRVKAAIFSALKAGQGGGWRMEYRVRKGGGWRWLHSRGRAVYGPDGTAARISGVVWDVSSLKRMEDALRESEARFRAAVESSCDWVWETDAEHRFTYVFDRSNVIGVSPSWFMGRTVAEVMQGVADPERLRAHLEDLEQRRPFRDFVYWIRRGRGWRCCSISGQPVFEADGTFQGFRGVGLDITEQRRDEERLELALAGSEGFLWDMHYEPGDDIYDPVEVYLAPEMKAILGFGDDELPSSLPAWYERVLPEDVPMLRQAIADYIAGRRPTYQVEYRVRHRDGSLRWVSSRGRVTRDPEGRPLRMTGVIWDITDRKEAELRQRMLLAELDHRVKNTLSRVQSIVAQSQRSATSVEEFAQRIQGRIAATARAHNLLTRDARPGVDLGALVREELAPHAEEGGVQIDGEPVRLEPAAAVSFAMALHELTTNAAKHGALSRPGGRIAVVWRREAGRLKLTWSESGGPPVPPAPARGFGSLLIERGLAYELRGTALLEFRPEGVRCLIDVPLEGSSA